MKKYILLYLFLFVAILAINYQYQRFKYAEANHYSKQIDSGGVMIMGDSWVANQKLDSLFPFEVKSFGFPGATSKRIYENLDSIIKRRPKYCIIIAGVNDRAQLMGSDYYSYHMRMIIWDLKWHDIKPVVVETPDFQMEELYEGMNPLSKWRNYITAYLNGSLDDDLKEYREKVDHAVNFPELSKRHYKDPAHLNAKGNEILCKAISDKLSYLHVGF